MHVAMLLAAAALALSAAAVAVIPAGATPTTVTFHLDGTHPVGVDYHQGTFTAPAPLCPSGTWQGNGQGGRVFTCADDSGTFTTLFEGELEHTADASGPWSIVAGTGTYVTLRGEGTAFINSSTGPDSSPIIFSDTWTGVVDFDATPPTGKFTGAKVTRPRAPGGRWRVRVRFVAHAKDNPVTYTATAASRAFFALQSGTVGAGTTTVSFTFRKRAGMRRLKVAIQLFDPVGNTTTIRLGVKLG
jgi:hypothetical protein